jgi:methyltransferase (TIGR00027 family)
MGVLDDPFARAMLTPSMAAVVDVVRWLPPSIPARSLTLAGLAARVLWFDSQVAEALDSPLPGTPGTPVTQVAVIGAGYDSRAWRLPRPGVQFFELDHPATQQDKARRAPAPDPRSGPVYVEAELTTHGAGEALVEHGLDPSWPTLFVVEGVTMYLAEHIVRRQLAELAQLSSPGSRLAVDFYPPPREGTARNHRQNRLQRLARSGSGETLRFTVAPPQAVELVAASGWDVRQATNLRDAARTLVPPASGLPVEAVNEHKTLVSGVRC